MSGDKKSPMMHEILYGTALAADAIPMRDSTQPVDVQPYVDRIRSAFSWPAYALPIESAPRDGSYFLAWSPKAAWFITAWSEHIPGSGFGFVHAACYQDREPTLWMPLPGAPK